ncbi:MAG TPA: Flp family type IVb pilin [Candidatus Limnocylindrales bacterium]|nr:Flp family type IVb pilin [Candidatus Limnocylindrales bacterium]
MSGRENMASAAVPQAEGAHMGFWRDESGQGLVEYALIIAVIAIAVIVAMVFFRGQLQNLYSDIANNVT